MLKLKHDLRKLVQDWSAAVYLTPGTRDQIARALASALLDEVERRIKERIALSGAFAVPTVLADLRRELGIGGDSGLHR